MAKMTVSRYWNENNSRYFFYEPDEERDFTSDTIEEHIDNHVQKNNLKSALFSLGDGSIKDGKDTKYKIYDAQLFHNSSGNINEPQKSYSILYILIASKEDPKTIGENQTIDYIPLERVSQTPFKVRANHAEIVVKEDENTISVNGEQYYVFAVLLGLGRHTGGASYKYKLRVNAIPQDITL